MGKNIAIITAGGSGTRLRTKIKKQFLVIDDKPLLIHTLDKFVYHPKIDEVIVTLPQEELTGFQAELKQQYPNFKIICLAGGVERQDSVLNALLACSQDTEIVLIHDGVRPFVTEQEIFDLIEMAKQEKAVIPVNKVKNTIKQIASDMIVKTVPREDLVAALTPQVFQFDLILELHKKANKENLHFTDDAAILEHYGQKVTILETSTQNIKVTDKFDLRIAEILLK
jgi:2-C-methyl-D-erythritol 4-phosphate cytidylyltransferase